MPKFTFQTPVPGELTGDMPLVNAGHPTYSQDPAAPNVSQRTASTMQSGNSLGDKLRQMAANSPLRRLRDGGR
jgi:hypothetical protein